MNRWHLSATSLISCAVLLALAAFSSRPSAQTPILPPADVLPQLLKEVQAIRSEVRDAAGISIQSQLLVARLQLQEQRILHLERQRTDVVTRLSAAEQGTAPLAAQLKMLKADGVGTDPDDKEVLGMLEAQLTRQQAATDALRLEASAINQAVSTEQARWTEFNARLDELEARLTRRQ